jgi:hypothetical protein
VRSAHWGQNFSQELDLLPSDRESYSSPWRLPLTIKFLNRPIFVGNRTERAGPPPKVYDFFRKILLRWKAMCQLDDECTRQMIRRDSIQEKDLSRFIMHALLVGMTDERNLVVLVQSEGLRRSH